MRYPADISSFGGEFSMHFLSFLIKPASGLCNLHCRYCFYEDETNNRSEKNRGIMKEVTMHLLIDRAFQEVSPNGRILFAFQGGEPTIAGLPFFRRFVDCVKSFQTPHVSVSYAIQTNGTLLDEEWAVFFQENRFLVGISMDGDKALHNLYRKDPAGKDTWNQVVKSLRLLQKNHVDVNALCVVTGQAARHPEKIYREMKSLGLEHLQYIACLDPIGEPKGKRIWSLSPESYGSFLCRLFDCWYQDWEKGQYHSIRLFDDYIHILLGDGASTCSTCGRCGSYFLVEADGSVYPCDFFALDDWYMGDIKTCSLSDLASGETVRRFLAESAKKPLECAGCRYSSVCNGGCRNDWVMASSGVQNYYCASFRMLLDYAMPRMQLIAHAELRQRSR